MAHRVGAACDITLIRTGTDNASPSDSSEFVRALLLTSPYNGEVALKSVPLVPDAPGGLLEESGSFRCRVGSRDIGGRPGRRRHVPFERCP